jgi:hypothetical protein
MIIYAKLVKLASDAMASIDSSTTMDNKELASKTDIFSNLVCKSPCIYKAYCIGIFPMDHANGFGGFLARRVAIFQVLTIINRHCHVDHCHVDDSSLNISFFLKTKIPEGRTI